MMRRIAETQTESFLSFYLFKMRTLNISKEFKEMDISNFDEFLKNLYR